MLFILVSHVLYLSHKKGAAAPLCAMLAAARTPRKTSHLIEIAALVFLSISLHQATLVAADTAVSASDDLQENGHRGMLCHV